MKISKLLGLAVVSAVVAGPAAAQFTAVVAPPKPKVDPAAVAAAPAVTARKDSIARITMTNMKDWVDSAAASLGNAVTPAVPDTAAHHGTPPLAVPARPAAPAAPPAAHGTTEFREGAPAPNTATPLPLVALLGALILASGLWLLRVPRAAQHS